MAFILNTSSTYMDQSAAQIAIGFALSGKWGEAVAINLKIISQDPADTDAMNRLARAYAELGKIAQAREIVKNVLKLDPVNPIALKCIEKLKTADRNSFHSVSPTSQETFLEEPGKTKLVTLMNMGNPKVFINLDPGEETKLISLPHKISINTMDGKYIGRLPDDLSARLRALIKAGNKYQALIKSAEPKEVTVFIREVERGPNAPNMSSFPTEKIDYVSFTPPELIHKDAPVSINPEDSAEE